MTLLAQYLPEDIVSELFLALCAIDKPCRKADYKPATLGWINATHTCRRWRVVALTHPALWASAVAAFPKGLSTFLKRSKNMPLTLNFTGVSLEEFPRFMKLLPRACSILHNHIWRCTSSLDWPATLSGLSLPLLETMHIEDPYAENNYSMNPSYKVIRIAPFTAPVLRTCIFRQTFVPFLAPNLQDLTIEDSYMDFKRLLHTLQGCPRLTSLRFTDGLGAFPMGNDQVAAAESIMHLAYPNSIARLPRLKLLSVHGYSPDVASFLEHLQFPSSARFNIEYSGYRDLDEFDKLVAALQPQISHCNTLTMTCMDESPHLIEFYVSGDASFSDDGGLPKASSTLRTGHSEWTGKLPSLLNCFAPGPIHTLAVYGNLDQTVITLRLPEEILHSLCRFTSVRTLYLQESGQDLLQLLVSVTSKVEVFPELHTIVIHHPQDYYPPAEAWWSRLVDFLRARKEALIPVHTLVVRGNFCHLDGRRGEVASPDALMLTGVNGLVEDVVDDRYDKCCCSG